MRAMALLGNDRKAGQRGEFGCRLRWNAETIRRIAFQTGIDAAKDVFLHGLLFSGITAAALFAAVFLYGLTGAGRLSAQAAPAIMSDGQIFDAEYYAAQNPDVVAVTGNTEERLYFHYTEYGKKEGRAPYDPSLDAATLQQQVTAEMQRRAVAARAALAPAGYDAAKELGVIMGDKTSDAQIQAVITAVASLNPAAPACYITYQFGDETYTVGPELAMTLMKTDKSGKYVVDSTTGTYTPDKTKVKNLLSILQARYGNHSTQGKFTATDGRTVKLAGIFANNMKFDLDGEADFLAEAITQDKAQERLPLYIPSRDYVEVDIKNQRAYYYKDGEQLVATNIVTGNTSLGHDTPTGVYRVRAKMTDTYLTGVNYRSFVHYWMPFIGNSVGLHDADGWRRYYGGQIYKTNGSHGCVNMPYAAAQKIFENITVGTPVVVFD